MGNNKEIDEIVSDLLYIKNAISKNSNIFKFISLNEILRRVYLIGAIIIIGFSGIFYYFIERHGGYSEIPANNKLLLYALIFAATVMVAFLKITSIMQAAKKINRNITLLKLFEEIYTTQFVLVVLPYLLVSILLPVFLKQNGLNHMLVPFLAIFIGLMCTSLVTVFYLRELIFLGGWLIVMGLLSLLGVIVLHPLLLTMLIFGLGFILLYIASYFASASEKEC